MNLEKDVQCPYCGAINRFTEDIDEDGGERRTVMQCGEGRLPPEEWEVGEDELPVMPTHCWKPFALFWTVRATAKARAIEGFKVKAKR